MQARSADLSQIQSKLIPWLQKQMPKATNLSISNMERSGAGFSNETFLFNLDWEEGKKPKSEGMVLRCPPTSYPIFPKYELGKQFRIMQILGKTDIPVPKVHWLQENKELLGTPFYIMGRLDGVVPPEFPPYHSFGVYFDATPAQRSKMWWGSLDAMAKINMLEWKKLGFSFLGVPKNAADAIDRQVNYLESYLNWAKDTPEESHPILEAALKWLKENRYEAKRIALCWGDPRIPNTMYSKTFDVVAILDWEMAFLGDPEADLAWFLFLDWQHTEGYGIPKLEGTPGKEETVQRYEELTGYKARNLFYNEVRTAVYFGIIMMKIFKNFKKMGVTIPATDDEMNNVGTRRLATLLNLPSPGPGARQVTKVEEVAATVQFRLTGPGGCEWYLLCDRGQGTRYDGCVDNPTCTLIISAEDWAAIQRGELERSQAWMSGKLKIEGDMTMLLQLEETISKFTHPG